MKRLLVFALIMLSAVLISGCIDYDEVLELNADGSGTLAMHVVVYKHYFEAISAMMSSFSADSSEDSGMFKLFTREEIEKKLKEHKSSAKLIDFKELQNDSTATYDIKFAFKDLPEMMRFNEEMGGSDMMGEQSAGPEVSFRQDKSGQWQFLRGFQGASMGEMLEPPVEPTEGEGEGMVEEEEIADSSEAVDSLVEPFVEAIDTAAAEMGNMMNSMTEMMTKAFADHKMRMTVIFPGIVTETNATSKSGNKAVWEYKFTDLAKAPKQLQATIKR